METLEFGSIPLPRIYNPYADKVNTTVFARCDHTSKSGAQTLASRLEDYWRQRLGFPNAKFWTEKQSDTGRGTRYAVRSNLVDGVPPK